MGEVARRWKCDDSRMNGIRRFYTFAVGIYTVTKVSEGCPRCRHSLQTASASGRMRLLEVS